MSYLIHLDGITYERKGGGTFTLTEALAEVYGVSSASILREDGTVAVDNAGSAYAVKHATRSGHRRTIRRRRTLAARLAWEADMAARHAARTYRCADPECAGHPEPVMVLA